MLARQPRPRKLTIDEFAQEYHLGREERYELIEGEAWLMSGGTARHSLTAVNILSELRARLRGSGCVPFNSDLLLEIHQHQGRLPDVAIYCDARDLSDLDQSKFAHPRVIFEVLSTSTEALDRRAKLAEYQSLPSIETIVFIDTRSETIEVIDRTGPASFATVLHPPGTDLVLRDPALTIPADGIFARA